MKNLLLASILALGVAGTAAAGPVSTDTWYTFGFGTPPDSAVSGNSFVPGTNPSSSLADDPPWTITLTGPATLTVLDLFLSVDQFIAYDFGVALGTTSAPTSGGGAGSNITAALADSRYSRGFFLLGAGNHSITIEHIAGQPGAGVFEITNNVPEPASAALLAIGLAGLAAARRRKR